MHAKKGFTIVELTVAITIASVALIAFLPMIANFLSAQYAQMAHAKQVNDMHKAITILNTDLQRAMKFRASTSIKDPNHPYNPELPIWYYYEDTRSGQLILSLPTTSLPYQDPNRQLVMAGRDPGCTNGVKEPLNHEVVYYINHRNKTLLRRTLVHKPENLHICDGLQIYQKTSGGPGGPSDIVVLNDLSEFRISYHTDQHTSSAPRFNSSIGVGGVATETIPYNQATITLTSSKNINGKQSDYTVKTRGSVSWNN